VASIRAARESRAIHDHEEAVALKNALETNKVKLPVKAGAEGRLFGAVKTVDVANAVKAAGLGDLDKRKIHITSPIKSVGEHEATIRLRDDLTAVITLQVVAAK
jgi:large subunit ribosomal protein L9